MTTREVTQQEIDACNADGAVCLRGLFDGQWIERLRAAVDEVMADPGPFGARYGKAADKGTFFGDMYVWTFNQTFRDFVHVSPAARIAGEIMAARKVNFFYDHLLVKEPGSAAPTDFIEGDLFKNDTLEEIPDIGAHRERYDIISWDTEPGDCILHHALTVHGAPGNDSTRRPRALATRWTGDDAVYVERKGMSKPIRHPGLTPGDPMDCDLFPIGWRAAA